MRKWIRTTFVLGVSLALTGPAFAASYIVWPGESVQATIDNAAEGDNITIKEGVYTENITIPKGLDIRPAQNEGVNEVVRIEGTVTISSVASPVYLADMTLGKSGASTVAITDCADVRLDRVGQWYQQQLEVNVTNSKLYLNNCNIGDTTFTSSEWRMKGGGAGDVTVDTSHTHIIGTSLLDLTHNSRDHDVTLLRASVNYKLFCEARKYWIAYNRIRYAEIRYGEGHFVGNRINGQRFSLYQEYPLSILWSNANVRNNTVFGHRSTVLGVVDERGPAIYLSGGTVWLVNNLIDGYREYAGSDFHATAGIKAGGTGAHIHANIVVNADHGVDAGTGANVTHCNFYAPNTAPATGGVQLLDCIDADPGFADSDFRLAEGSACKNAGPEEAHYNDLDGTRNDIGCWGGHGYDPNGRTATVPIVLASEVSPLYIKRGGTVTLQARGAVVQE